MSHTRPSGRHKSEGSTLKENGINSSTSNGSRSRDDGAKTMIDKGLEVCSSARVNCLIGADEGVPPGNTDSTSRIKVRRFQRFDELQPSVSVENKILSKAEKITSPLRRSGRIGKQQFCPNSSSKASKNCVERGRVEQVFDREFTLVTEDQKRNSALDSFDSKKKKRLMDARSYLSSMKVPKKKATLSDIQRPELVVDASEAAANASRETSAGNNNQTVPEACLGSPSPSIVERNKFIGSSGIHRKKGTDNDTQDQDHYAHSLRVIKSNSDTSDSKDRTETNVTDSIGGAEDMDCSELKKFQPKFQTEFLHDICIICKNPGMLLHCYGKDCQRSYHLSCVEPPLEEVPPGIWLCICCLRKKIESGIYSVCKGMERVCDTRVLELSDHPGVKNVKQYLVKYTGLAYVHNQWVTEDQLLLEASNLLAEYNKRSEKEKAMLWKSEWTIPESLLLKRLIMPPDLADDCFSGSDSCYSHCYYEWLVKWTGLGYENATWEFESSSFLATAEAKRLIENYETRRDKECGSSSIIQHSELFDNNVPSGELNKPIYQGNHGVVSGNQMKFSHPDTDSAKDIVDLTTLVESGKKASCDTATGGETWSTTQLSYVATDVISPNGAATGQVHGSRGIHGPHQSLEAEFYVKNSTDGIDSREVPSTTQIAAAPTLHTVVDAQEKDLPAIPDEVSSELVPCASMPNITATLHSNDTVPCVENERSTEHNGIGMNQPPCSSQQLEIFMIQNHLKDSTPAAEHDMLAISDVGSRPLHNSQLNVNSSNDSVPTIAIDLSVTADVERTKGHCSIQLTDSRPTTEHGLAVISDGGNGLLDCSQLNLNSKDDDVTTAHTKPAVTSDLEGTEGHNSSHPILIPSSQIGVGQPEDPVLMRLSPSTALLSAELGQASSSTAIQNEQADCSELCSEIMESPGQRQTNVQVEKIDNLTHASNLDDPCTRSSPSIFISAQLPSHVLSPDPLQNEMLRIQKERASVDLKFKDEKLRLNSDYKTEFDKLTTKYHMLLEDVEATFLMKKRSLEMIYEKVYVNHILAKEFRIETSRFHANTAATANTSNLKGCTHTLSSAQGQVTVLAPSSAVPSSAVSNISMSTDSAFTFRQVDCTYSASFPTTRVHPCEMVRTSQSHAGRQITCPIFPSNGGQLGSDFHSLASGIQSSQPPVCMPSPNLPFQSVEWPVQLQTPINNVRTFRPVNLLQNPSRPQSRPVGDPSYRIKPGNFRPLC